MYEDPSITIQGIVDELVCFIKVLKQIFVRVIVYSDVKMRIFFEMAGFVDIEIKDRQDMCYAGLLKSRTRGCNCQLMSQPFVT